MLSSATCKCIVYNTCKLQHPIALKLTIVLIIGYT